MERESSISLDLLAENVNERMGLGKLSSLLELTSSYVRQLLSGNLSIIISLL